LCPFQPHSLLENDKRYLKRPVKLWLQCASGMGNNNVSGYLGTAASGGSRAGAGVGPSPPPAYQGMGWWQQTRERIAHSCRALATCCLLGGPPSSSDRRTAPVSPSGALYATPSAAAVLRTPALSAVQSTPTQAPGLADRRHFCAYSFVIESTPLFFCGLGSDHSPWRTAARWRHFDQNFDCVWNQFRKARSYQNIFSSIFVFFLTRSKFSHIEVKIRKMTCHFERNCHCKLSGTSNDFF